MPVNTRFARQHQGTRNRLLGSGSGRRTLPTALQHSARGPSPMAAPQIQFSTDPNAIVTVNVTTIQAPTPNTYQQCGALVSFGGSNILPSTAEELTQWEDIDQFVIPPQTIATVTWATGEVEVTLAAPINPAYAAGDTPVLNISGFAPEGYNYNGPVEIVDPTTFTYPVATDPGAPTTIGIVQPQDAIELSQMATTFFDQGNAVTVWVLELGLHSTIANAIAALTTWLDQNPKTFYGYLMPRKFGTIGANLTALEPLLKHYQNPEAMTYFWMTVTPATMSQLGPTYKNVFQMVEAPSVYLIDNLGDAGGEFTIAAPFYNAMAFRPSQINRVAPMAFKYLYGVTAYPTQNNGPLLSSFKAEKCNYVSTGAEGGISYDIIYDGVTLDGYDYFSWWWTIDWVAINVNLNLSNAIINGSNNPFAPLYYDQPGINMLAAVAHTTMSSASTFGMVVGAITQTGLNQPDYNNAVLNGQFAGMCDVNAVSFADYTLANPGDFKIGEYDGLSILFIPARGFIHILVQISASSLVSV